MRSRQRVWRCWEKIATYRRSTGGQGGLIHHRYVMGAFRGRRYRLEQLDCLAWNGKSRGLRPPRGPTPHHSAGPDWADRVHAFFRRMPKQYGRGIRWGQSALTINVDSWMVDPALNDHLPADHAVRRFVAALGSFTRTPDHYPARTTWG